MAGFPTPEVAAAGRAKANSLPRRKNRLKRLLDAENLAFAALERMESVILPRTEPPVSKPGDTTPASVPVPPLSRDDCRNFADFVKALDTIEERIRVVRMQPAPKPADAPKKGKPKSKLGDPVLTPWRAEPKANPPAQTPTGSVPARQGE